MHNFYLASEDSPRRAFFFCTFSGSRLALLASTVPWLCCFIFLNAANRRLRSVLDSAKHVRCGGQTALFYPSYIVKKRCSSLSSIASGILPHVHVSTNRHSWAWQTRIRTYIHCENRSLIQSLALMRSAKSEGVVVIEFWHGLNYWLNHHIMLITIITRFSASTS